MAITKYTCPPQAASGAGTFSDDLVGLQLVSGGGLTQGNFEFVSGVNEKSNRTFSTGNFSQPINLEGLGLDNVAQSRAIFENNFKVYPNFDLSQITNFTLYGSMVKRISASIETIISKFPAALESTFMGINYTTGETASNIVYDTVYNETSFELDVDRIRNPFDIDFSVNSTRNLELKEIHVSPLRDMTLQYAKYSLYYSGAGYDVVTITPTATNTTGILKLKVKGNPFSGQTTVFSDLVIRPNDYEVSRVFNESLDEVENFLLNRNVTPLYTAIFQVPMSNEDGTYYTGNEYVTWPLSGQWNLDIISKGFEDYLTRLQEISANFDTYTTNLISRFLITGAFKDFDTLGQKMEKVLQIYGRSFDETKKFIDALAYMNSVHYNIGNDIPSQLLKNLSQTLGWSINMSPISETNFLDSVFGQKNVDKSAFSGVQQEQTPDELNYQYYRNLVLNSAYLFKSKGTRKSVETLMRLIGAPEALVEFNEYVYVADQKINLKQFNVQYFTISGGTYVNELPTYELGNTFSIMGNTYTGFTTQTTYLDVNITLDEYPMDSEGFPLAPPDTEDYYFQIGSGWFEQTPQHRAPEEVNLTNSVFTGANPNYQTELKPYTYGQVYLDRFRQFPFMNLGYNLRAIPDNNKSWTDNEVGLRVNLDGGINARYYTTDDRLVLNVKNVDLFMNPAQGIAYDIWYMSRQFNYPIPNQGLNYVAPTYCDPHPNLQYPVRGGIDWTEINPQPKRKTFFEFAQTFWVNTINVRNRQFATDGKTSGYPTLSSIFWKYLESEETINVPNDNYTYETMIKYVEGMGDYWVRLVEQMMPATTLWNTGVKYENSIFHRQKFVWRRQEGCQIVPVPCKPCELTSNLFRYDCDIQLVECAKYPWGTNPTLTSFNSVLGLLMQNYLTQSGYVIGDCDLNTVTSEWFVELIVDGNVLVKYPFFTGVGYVNPTLSAPSVSQWDSALLIALNDLKNYGYDYYLTTEGTVVIYNSICSVSDDGLNFKLNVGINFNIMCSD
jgi:hypothetical protein